MPTLIKKYKVNLDSKKRLTIRDSAYTHYNVAVFDDGKILLSPQILIDPDTISKKTLKMIEKSIKNFKKGKASKQIDLEKYCFNEE